MKILGVKIKGLFDLFEYNLSLNHDEDLTILTGPNGYGKTTILNILCNLFSKKFFYFQKLNFEEVVIYLDNEQRLEIKKKTEKKVTQNIIRIDTNTQQVIESSVDVINVHLELYDKSNTNIGTFIYNSETDLGLVRELERSLPINRISEDIWLDRRTGKQITLAELLNDSFNLLSPKIVSNIQRQGIRNENILTVLNGINVYMIKEQRLIRQSLLVDRRVNPERENPFVNTIEEYAKELASLISQKRQEAYLIAQSLDSSFPKRLLECKEDLGETEFKERFNALIEKQTKLQEFGLSTSKPELTDYNKQNAKVLSVYLKDSEQKTEVYDDLLKKIELFVNILNGKRFTHKSISINSEQGLVFTTVNGNRLNLTDLSSGEQHEVVLLYELLFKTNPNTLILIDEPEISLHVTWQKVFIDDLLQIAKMLRISVLVATHSPQIINNRWSLTKDLFEIANMN